jgi:phytoene desaturase
MEKIVVVGAGFGGLAAAIRLQAKGYDVCIAEANDQAGGRARVFEKDGYVFDAGPTVITAPYLVEELFTLCGKDWQDYFEMMPVDPFYRVAFNDGSHFDYVGDTDRLIEQIKEFHPPDVDGYLRFVEHAKEIFETGYVQLADAPFDRFMDMVRIAPKMIKLGNYQSVYHAVSSFIKDERLRQVFSFQPLLIGGNPFQSTSIYLLIHWLERKWGVHFPKGGTGALVQALCQLFRDIGGEIRTQTPIEEIEIESGKVKAVQTENGERIPCNKVVCNADPSFVYKNMIDSKWRKRHADKKIDARRNSMSLFVGYFGLNQKYDDIAHHTIIMGPRYKELLKDIFQKRVLADDFSLYLHRPTASDPELAPKGSDGFYVLSPVPNQKSGIDWSETGEPYFNKILDSLEPFLPNLRQNMDCSFFVDPRYFENDLRSVDGAAFGLEPILTQSAYFRFHNRSEDVENLYFVGAGTHPGAGLPGVLCSAKVLEKVI